MFLLMGYPLSPTANIFSDLCASSGCYVLMQKRGMSLAESSRPGSTPQPVHTDRARVQSQLPASASDLKLKWKFSTPSFEISDLPQSLPRQSLMIMDSNPSLLIQAHFLPSPQTWGHLHLFCSIGCRGLIEGCCLRWLF